MSERHRELGETISWEIKCRRSVVAAEQRGILTGLRMARKAVRAKGDKGMAVYAGPISAIDALIEQRESTEGSEDE